MSRPLTPKQQMFVREYLVDLNATQAAIRAGYSAKTAEWIGPQLLGKNHVAAKIQELQDIRAGQLELTAKDVLKSIILIRDKAVVEGKHAAALKANELLGKHLKLFTDKVEHSGKITLEDLLADER